MTEKINSQQPIQPTKKVQTPTAGSNNKAQSSANLQEGLNGSKAGETNGKGTSVEKHSKTITLKSGRKIVVEDGKTRYYAADGTALKEEYFQKQEGEISVKVSGRYSVTKAGKTRYYAADGTELKESYFKQVENKNVKVKSSDGKTYDLNEILEKRINNVSGELEKAESENGFIGKAWSGIKNLTGIGDSSNKVREQQETEKKLLSQFNSNPQNRAKVFKELTGQEYNDENLERFIKGELKLKSEVAVSAYKEGQDMACDITGDIVSGIAAVGIYSAAVAAAPFTGGASIAVGLAAAAATGAVVKIGVKAADAATGGSKYTLKEAGHDAATGAFSGILAPITGGMGGAVGKTVATKLGLQAVKQVGKEVAETAVKSGAKQTIKTMLTNPTGYEYAGGSLLKRELAYGAEFATGSAVFGGSDNAFRTAVNGGSVEDAAEAAGEGVVYGAVLGPLGRYVFKGAGRAFRVVKSSTNKIFSKSSSRSSSSTVEKNAGSNISRELLKDKIKQGEKLSIRDDNTSINIPKGRFEAPSEKFAATPEAYREMLWNYRYDIAYLNKHIKDKAILAEALNAIGNEGMDFTGIEHPFKINNLMSDRGSAAFDGTSAVEINTRRFDLSDEFKSDIAEMAHRVFHEKRHVYQNIQRSLKTGGTEPLELYAYDLSNSYMTQTSTEGYLKYLSERNGEVTYDFKVATSGRFPANLGEEDIDFAMHTSYNQANYIETGLEYWEQFVEKDAEGVGRLCGSEVENIIRMVMPDESRISRIAKAAKYAQDNNVSFDDAFNSLKRQARRLDPLEHEAVNKILAYLLNKYPNAELEVIQGVIDDAINEMRKPEYQTYTVEQFVNYFKTLF